MRVIDTKKGYDGVTYRIVDDANPNYNYHDIVIEKLIEDKETNFWIPLGVRFHEEETAKAWFERLINMKINHKNSK